MASGSIQMNGSADFTLTLTVTESATDPTANTSSAAYSLVINPPGNWEAYNLTSSNQSYSININGTVISGNFTYDFRSPNNNTNKTVKSGTVTGIAHEANGSKTIASTATVNTNNSGIGDGTVASFNTVLTDFVRVPGTPAAPTLSRSSDGITVTVTSAVPSSAVSITDYNFRSSTDNATWSSAVSMGSDGVATFTGTATSVYFVQTQAYSSEGWGDWSSSNSIAGIPSAPASISTDRMNRNVTVTAGSSTDNGSMISAYKVQWSDNAGTSWSTAQTMSSQVYTYVDLPAGKTYLFRVQAENGIGASSFTTSSGVFIAAGGKRWDGSVWVSASSVKRWDGSAWTEVLTAKRWDGSAWTDLN